jgi:hypothetical protein
MMRVRKLTEAGHVSVMEKRNVVYRLQVGNVKERDVGGDRKIKLNGS